jgi:Homeodomain-like domain
MSAAAGEIDMRRADVCLYLNPSDRAKLEAIMANRSSPSKWVWRADIVLATAEGLGTNAIMQRTGMSKPCVWRWQERYMDEGVRAARLAAILVGESPTSIGVQSML